MRSVCQRLKGTRNHLTSLIQTAVPAPPVTAFYLCICLSHPCAPQSLLLTLLHVPFPPLLSPLLSFTVMSFYIFPSCSPHSPPFHEKKPQTIFYVPKMHTWFFSCGIRPLSFVTHAKPQDVLENGACTSQGSCRNWWLTGECCQETQQGRGPIITLGSVKAVSPAGTDLRKAWTAAC